MQDSCVADVARCGHVAEPREPKWMPTWRDETIQLIGMLAHWYSGPTEGIIGAYLAHLGDAIAVRASPFYTRRFSLISFVWDYLFLLICRRRGGVWCVGSNGVNQRESISWIEVHRILIDRT